MRPTSARLMIVSKQETAGTTPTSETSVAVARTELICRNAPVRRGWWPAMSRNSLTKTTDSRLNDRTDCNRYRLLNDLPGAVGLPTGASGASFLLAIDIDRGFEVAAVYSARCLISPRGGKGP